MREDLSAWERRFIRAIAPAYSDKITSWLEAQPRILESQKFTQTNRFAVFLISAVRAIKLAVEVLKAHSGKALDTDAAIFYEKDPASIEKRIAFLEDNEPDTAFAGVSYNNSVRTVPDASFTFRVLPLLLGTIFASAFRAPSRLTPHLVRIVRTCLLALDRVEASTANQLYLFRISRVETPFVAAFLKEHGIGVHLVASSTPLSFYQRVLIGDSLKACHPYQLDEFQYYRQLGICNSCELWSPETFHRIKEYYAGRSLEEHFETIGVYTQGAQLRDRLGTYAKGFAAKAIRRETELLQMVAFYARAYRDVSFVVFPHPMERRHYARTGDHQFDRLARFPNISVDLQDAADSTLQFDRVGLGITTLSSIGFERISLGLRTIFYVSELEYINWDIESPYHRLFFAEREVFLSALDAIRRLTHGQFIRRFFGHGSLRVL